MFEKISDYSKAVIREIKSIVWPSRRQVYYDTLVVVGALVVGGAAIALLDYGFTRIFQVVIGKLG